MKKSLCLILTYSLALQPIVPVFAGDTLDTAPSQIGAGDTAKALPNVANICKRLEDASNGNFVDTAGKPILVTRDDCLNKPRRERNKPECKIKVSELLAGISNNEAKQAKIDALCGTGSGGLGQAGEAYCALRQATKDGQSLKYCEANKAAAAAQKGLRWILALDVAAAGVCWAEYFVTKSQMATGGLKASGLSAAGQSGACGGVAMAAGMGELAQTIKVVTSGKKSAGKYKVDSNNNVEKRDGFWTAIELVMSAGMSLKAIQIGVCYYNKEHAICKGVQERTAARGEKKPGTKAYGEKQAETRTTAKNLGETGSDLAKKGEEWNSPIVAGVGNTMKQSSEQMKKLADQNDKMYQRMEMARQAGMIFTALSAMRGVAIMSAAKTKKQTEALLQSMLQNDGGPSFGTSGMSGSGNGLFSAVEGSGFASTSNQPNQSSVTAMPPGSIESFLSPPGSPISNQAGNIARQIPDSKLDDAAEGGAGGLGGMIASVASASGAKGDLSEIRSAMHSAFANLPKEEGGYGGSGGGKPLASKGDAGGDLNLKSLFGAGEKEGETSEGRTDIAFRDPAAEEDIWHSQNPSGNNIFQIISEKYDRVQRKSAVGTDL